MQVQGSPFSSTIMSAGSVDLLSYSTNEGMLLPSGLHRFAHSKIVVSSIGGSHSSRNLFSRKSTVSWCLLQISTVDFIAAFAVPGIARGASGGGLRAAVHHSRGWKIIHTGSYLINDVAKSTYLVLKLTGLGIMLAHNKYYYTIQKSDTRLSLQLSRSVLLEKVTDQQENCACCRRGMPTAFWNHTMRWTTIRFSKPHCIGLNRWLQ